MKIHEVRLRGTVTTCKYTLRSVVEHRPGHYVAFAHFEFPEKRLFYHDDLANHGYAVPIPGPRAKMITASDGTPALSFYVLESLESSTTALPTTETSSLAAGTSAVVADTSAVAADEIIAGPRHAIRKRKREGDESSAVVQNPSNDQEFGSEVGSQASSENGQCIVCKGSFVSSDWVQCDRCDRWIHCFCAAITLSQARTMERYSCNECGTHGPPRRPCLRFHTPSLTETHHVNYQYMNSTRILDNVPVQCAETMYHVLMYLLYRNHVPCSHVPKYDHP